VSYDYRHPERFLGLDDSSSDAATSAVWVLPVPFEMTTSYSGGTRLGPAAIIEASNQVELYDAAVGGEAALIYGVHTLPTLHLPLSSAESAHLALSEAIAALPLAEKLLVTLGGEHSLTPGVLRALAPRWPGLAIVQIDAHADLRDSFDGTPFSHACAMRRALDCAPEAELHQFGIRSVCQEEVDYAAQSPRVRTWTAEAMHADAQRTYLADLRAALADRPVYLTIDVDGLDPSVIAATGTPEPGGIGWYECLALIAALAQSAQVVAFDCVELSTAPGAQASSFAAAKLVYKTMNVIMRQRGLI
jgi:agmatinase